MTFCQTITKLYILRLFSCHCQKTPTCAALRERVEGAASEQLSSYPPHCLQSFHRRSILACLGCAVQRCFSAGWNFESKLNIFVDIQLKIITY